MGASVTGIFTLVAILIAGPAYYALERFYRKRTGTEKAARPKQEEGERHEYDTGHYLFGLIGYAIGVGNIWRFPYMIAQNGGGSALVAYVICAIFVVVPLFLYEMIIGQHVRLSTIHCYEKIRPRWQSLGIASGLMMFIVTTYYAMVCAYTLPYIWHSMESPLPWAEVGAEKFWSETVVHAVGENEQVSGLGPIQWNLAVSLVGFWIITFLACGFGREVLAKVTYVTVILPFIMTAILVLRCVFLPGATDGLKFYLGRFEAGKLLSVRTWAAACSQIMFSLSPGFGTAITYSSYTNKKEDVYKACMIVAVSNSLFSIIGGLATFSLVGHIAFQQAVDVEDVATRQGTGLAFVTMAEAMQYFGGASNCLSVVFFVMLFMLGLDSAYAMLETLTSYVEDFIDDRGFKQPPRFIVTAVNCCVMCILGLTFATRRGNQLLEVFDHFIAGIFLLIVACMEAVMIKLDFTYQRLDFALKKATYDNAATPDGRSLFPSFLCKTGLHGTVPLISGLLAVYLIVLDGIEPFNGFPMSLNMWGWIFMSLLFAISLTTLWKKDPTGLEPFTEEDIKMRDDDVIAANNEGGHDNLQTPGIEIT